MNSMEKLADTYAIAVYDKDEATFLSLYDPDIFVFDAWGPWSYEGRNAWAEMVRNWFASLGEERVRVSFMPEKTLTSEDWAVWCATVRYAAIAPSGEELRALENRITWSLRRRDGAWRIVHEHSSGPADFETLKVKLHRA